MCLVYSSACGYQLIRFSYATNLSRPQESGYMQATYKKRKHVKHTIWYHSSQQTTRACGSMVTCYIHIITTLASQFTVNRNFLWSKRSLYIKHFDTSDADFSFILGSNNWINPTFMNHVSIHVRLVWRRSSSLTWPKSYDNTNRDETILFKVLPERIK